jgi:hypothetical protein
MSLSVGSLSSSGVSALYQAPSNNGRQSLARQQERVEVDAAPEAAVIEIRTRNPEMEAHWDPVWRERGFLKVQDQVEEIKAVAQERYARDVSLRVQGGRRIGNLAKEKGNVFGRVAYDKFLASRKRTVEIAAAPKFGVQIDVRIYPPEITVDTNFKWERDG